MPGTPLDQLLEQTDPEGCHVVGLPSRIWVLGGRCENDDGPTRSFRDAFWRASLVQASPAWLKDLLRPEELAGWLEHSGYDDLLEFVRDACHLCRAILLFAESPGSCAELGTLAIEHSLLRKLAVVVQDKHRKEIENDSFLNLGPLRRVEKDGRLCVIGAETDFVLAEGDYEAIIESVDTWLPVPHKKEKLSADNSAHVFLLIADLVDVLLIATEHDLLKALSHFKVTLSIEALKKHLKLLNFLRLVRLVQHGSVRYWLREGDDGPWVDYTSINKAVPFDRARFKIKSTELIEKDRKLWSIYERGRK